MQQHIHVLRRLFDLSIDLGFRKVVSLAASLPRRRISDSEFVITIQLVAICGALVSTWARGSFSVYQHLKGSHACKAALWRLSPITSRIVSIEYLGALLWPSYSWTLISILWCSRTSRLMAPSIDAMEWSVWEFIHKNAWWKNRGASSTKYYDMSDLSARCLTAVLFRHSYAQYSSFNPINDIYS